jgi:DNA invertase Pin-like site-specific DNA recombinase
LKPQAYSYLRMSTDLQLKGDSRRRQLELSRAYAEANGLELAEGAELEDIGVSAFKGANVRGGALGVFLDAVRSGTIKPGSYLLVESLDRLTRQQLLKANSLFLSIIQAGINLVTLADGRVYPAGTNDLGDLILSLVIMSRAHEESQIKSHRISAAWKNKRAKALTQVPMTKWCPAWLKLADDRTHYVQIPERVEVVRGIFQDAASGMGIYSIATRLNRASVPTFDSPTGWHTSYIAKILGNRAVLGEFQPHIRENSKRVPIGEPSRDYYPAIVDEELFYRAQVAKSERRVSGAGRKGATFTNLFSNLATCAYCKSPVKLENKGTGRKGGTYLICDGALRKLGCPSLRWRYRDFETSFLAFVEEVDLDGVVTDSSDQARKFDGEISALKGELAEVGGLMEKTYAVLSGGGPVEFVTTKLRELEARRGELLKRLQRKEREREAHASRKEQMRRSKDEIRALISRLQEAGDDQLFKLRARVASHLKTLIGTLTVASVGERPLAEARLDRFRLMTGSEHQDIATHMSALAASPNQARRYFAVGLRDNKVRIVFPAYDDPLCFEQQIVTGQSPFEGEERSIVLHHPDRPPSIL